MPHEIAFGGALRVSSTPYNEVTSLEGMEGDGAILEDAQSPDANESTRHLIRLHSNDNVFVVGRFINQGELLHISGRLVAVKTPLEIGHKIANQRINRGEAIIKYGVPIGSATYPIEPGEHVHVHNMKSDYLPAHSRSERFD